MVDPGVLLVSGLGAGAALVAGARGRRAPGAAPTLLRAADYGLSAWPPAGALVQYSAPASRACRVSLNRLAAATAPHRGRMMVVELHARAPGSRELPTVFLVDAEGRIQRRWTRPPDREELRALLATRAAPAARCFPAAAR
jgi:hypothetical protein